MLLPTQQAAATSVTALMTSIIDETEKRRLEDEDKASGKKDDQSIKTKIRSDEAQRAATEKLNEHFFNRNVVDVNELKVNLIQKLGKQLGIEKEDGQSGFSYGRQLENAITQLDSQQLFALNKALGLFELGVSLDDLVKAIKNPYGEEDDKLETALEEQASGISGTTISRTKALQRLESVADPKSLEELKLEKAGAIKDPTKVEDAEVKAEREKQIGALEAGEKLEDVTDLQKTVKQQNEQAANAGGGTPSPSSPDTTAATAIDTIQVLAAGAEAATPQPLEGVVEAQTSTDPESVNGDNDLLLSEEEEVYLITENGPDTTDTTNTAILPITVDENGIYELLAKKKAA